LKKSHYIKKAEDYISTSKKILIDTSKPEHEKERASFHLSIAESWLVILKSGKHDSARAEKIIEEVYNRDKVPPGVLLSPNDWYFVSSLFKDLYRWVRKSGLVTENIERWKNELYINEVDSIDRYYDCWNGNPPDGHVQLAKSTLKKWINIINASTITQQNIDELINPFLGWQFVSGSMFWTVYYEIRDWAEIEGFKVISKKGWDKHWKKVWNNFVEQIKLQNQKSS
jgi:hypothetical protein